MILPIPMNKDGCAEIRLEYRKSGKTRDIATKLAGPPDTDCKNQADT